MISPVVKWVEEKTGLGKNLDPQSLRSWQQDKLNDVVDYARRNSKFYSEQLGNTSDLEDLPFTYPSDIANAPLAFLAIPQSEVVRVTTLANSGTTNLRKRIFFSKNDLERTKEFFAIGMSAMVSKGERAQILISNRTENSLGCLLKESLSRIGVNSEISPAIKTVHEAIEASRSADCLIGMPAEMLYMSKFAPELRPKSVLLAADIARQSMIKSIRETWKCDVFTHYGHSEFGFGCAVDCSCHSGLHLRDIDLIFEIIDLSTNKSTKPGELGEIVITTLSSEAMPLIRYRTGNLSRLIHTPCGCGGLLSRLGGIEGRIPDNILIDNEVLSIHQLDEIVFADPKIRGFDALLKSEGRRTILQLTVDADGYLDVASVTAKLPKSVSLEVMYDKADPFSRRAKRRIYVG